AMEHNTEDFAGSVSAVMQSLLRSSEGIRDAAASMTEAAQAVHAQAVSTSDGAIKASEDLTTVAGEVEELIASVQEISLQVSAATSVSHHAVERAQAGQ